jgi:hypothetical protein
MPETCRVSWQNKILDTWCSLLVIYKKYGYPLGSHEVEAPRISAQSAQYGGKVVSPTLRPSLRPQKLSLVPISARGWVDLGAIMRPVGWIQWKIPVTPIANRTRDLPICRPVPQLTAPPRAPVNIVARFDSRKSCLYSRSQPTSCCMRNEISSWRSKEAMMVNLTHHHMQFWG